MFSHFNRVQLFATLWTIAHYAPLSMGFSRQEYWSGLPFPPPGDFANPGIEPMSPVFPALQEDFFTTEPLEKVSAKSSTGPSLWNPHGSPKKTHVIFSL